MSRYVFWHKMKVRQNARLSCVSGPHATINIYHVKKGEGMTYQYTQQQPNNDDEDYCYTTRIEERERERERNWGKRREREEEGYTQGMYLSMFRRHRIGGQNTPSRYRHHRQHHQRHHGGAHGNPAGAADGGRCRQRRSKRRESRGCTANGIPE